MQSRTICIKHEVVSHQGVISRGGLLYSSTEHP